MREGGTGWAGVGSHVWSELHRLCCGSLLFCCSRVLCCPPTAHFLRLPQWHALYDSHSAYFFSGSLFLYISGFSLGELVLMGVFPAEFWSSSPMVISAILQCQGTTPHHAPHWITGPSTAGAVLTPSDQEQPGKYFLKSPFLHFQVVLPTPAHSLTFVHSEWIFFLSGVQVPSSFWRPTFYITLRPMGVNEIQVLSLLGPSDHGRCSMHQAHILTVKTNVRCVLGKEAVLPRAYRGRSLHPAQIPCCVC